MHDPDRGRFVDAELLAARVGFSEKAVDRSMSVMTDFGRRQRRVEQAVTSKVRTNS
jgi:hypothetical protein